MWYVKGNAYYNNKKYVPWNVAHISDCKWSCYYFYIYEQRETCLWGLIRSNNFTECNVHVCEQREQTKQYNILLYFFCVYYLKLMCVYITLQLIDQFSIDFVLRKTKFIKYIHNSEWDLIHTFMRQMTHTL